MTAWTRGVRVMAGRKARDSSVDREPGAESQERRQWQRVLVDLEVDYGNEDNYLFAYIRDISATGIFVRTNSPEPPGTHLNVRFTPHGSSNPLELEGEVIWINRYRPGDSDNLHPGMGIRFIGLTDEERRRLSELIKTFAYLADEE
jgi:type IV pilus assembly protein PilZ